MCYKFLLSHRTSTVEKRINSCLLVSLSFPPLTSPVLPLLFCCGMCQHLSWQKPVLDLKTEENSSLSVTDSAFTRAPLLPAPVHTKRRERLGLLQGGTAEGHPRGKHVIHALINQGHVRSTILSACTCTYLTGRRLHAPSTM